MTSFNSLTDGLSVIRIGYFVLAVTIFVAGLNPIWVMTIVSRSESTAISNCPSVLVAELARDLFAIIVAPTAGVLFSNLTSPNIFNLDWAFTVLTRKKLTRRKYNSW